MAKWETWVNKHISKALNAVTKSYSTINPSTYVSIQNNESVHFSQRIPDSTLVKEGYADSSDVYSITKDIGNKTAQIPLNVDTVGSNGSLETVNSGLMYDLIYKDPDESKTTKFLKASLNLNLTGDLYFEFVKSFGFSVPVQMVVHRSCCVEIRENNDFFNSYDFTVWENGEQRVVKFDDMLHIKNYDPNAEGMDSKKGISPLQAGYLALFASNELQVASASLLKNKGASYILSNKNQSLDSDEESKVLQDNLNRKIGGASKFNTITATNAEIDVHEIGMSSKDLELIKSHPIQLRKLCNIYGVDSIFYNDPSGTTYNNLGFATKKFYTNGVQPNLQLITEEISRYLSRYEKGVVLVPDYSSIEALQVNQKEEVEKNTIEASGLMDVLVQDISKNQKMFILINTWKKTEEEAQSLVG